MLRPESEWRRGTKLNQGHRCRLDECCGPQVARNGIVQHQHYGEHGIGVPILSNRSLPNLCPVRSGSPIEPSPITLSVIGLVVLRSVTEGFWRPDVQINIPPQLPPIGRQRQYGHLPSSLSKPLVFCEHADNALPAAARPADSPWTSARLRRRDQRHAPDPAARHLRLTGCEGLQGGFADPGGSIKVVTATRPPARRGTQGGPAAGRRDRRGHGWRHRHRPRVLGASRGYRHDRRVPETQSRAKIEHAARDRRNVRLVPRSAVRQSRTLCARGATRHRGDERTQHAAHRSPIGSTIRPIETFTRRPLASDLGQDRRQGRSLRCASGRHTLAASAARSRRDGRACASLADPARSALALRQPPRAEGAEGDIRSAKASARPRHRNFARDDRPCAVDSRRSVAAAAARAAVDEGLRRRRIDGVTSAGAIHLARDWPGPRRRHDPRRHRHAFRCGEDLRPGVLRAKSLPVPEWLDRAFPQPHANTRVDYAKDGSARGFCTRIDADLADGPYGSICSDPRSPLLIHVIPRLTLSL